MGAKTPGAWTPEDRTPGASTPILDALIRHVQAAVCPLHVPGHRQGRLLPAPLALWLGQAAKLDLTELPGLDDLQQPDGCIAASQALAAAWYGSEACWYSVNGSTAGVMAALMAAVPEGGKVLFLNPCHQSAWRGVLWSGAVPAFWPPRYSPVLRSVLPPTADDAAAALAAHPDAAAVFLTSPTYQGWVAPVGEIAQVVHAAGKPLLVDEAHGAHLGLAPGLPPHSVAAGADVVVQSVHKLLPGLTQTAWVHCQGPRVAPERVAEMLRLLQTTSPSYLLLASIDAVQAWLRTDGASTAARALTAVAAFWAEAGPVDAGLPPGIRRDPLRHWQPVPSRTAGADLQRRLATAGVVPEYGDALGVLSIFGLGAREADVARYLEVWRAWAAAWGMRGAGDDLPSAWWDELFANLAAPFALPPRQAFHRPRTRVPVRAAAGRVCAQPVTPYPPGVPVIWPGQRFSPALCEAIAALADMGLALHGLADGCAWVLA